MLRNRLTKQPQQPLVEEQDDGSDEGEALLGERREKAPGGKNNLVAKAGRLFMDLLYAITDIIPGINLVGDVPVPERLWAFKAYVSQAYTVDNDDHFELLKSLWQVCADSKGEDYGDLTRECVVSETWKKFGFQGTDPGTDFRGGGVFSLKNLIFFANYDPELFARLLSQPSSLHSIPFAIAGINITMMLLHLLQFVTAKTCFSTAHNNSSTTKLAKKHILNYMLDESADASTDEEIQEACARVFNKVYAGTFKILFVQWEAEPSPNIMQFNSVLLKTKSILEDKLRSANTLQQFTEGV